MCHASFLCAAMFSLRIMISCSMSLGKLFDLLRAYVECLFSFTICRKVSLHFLSIQLHNMTLKNSLRNPSCSVVLLLIISLFWGGTVASWLVHSTPEQAVRF